MTTITPATYEPGNTLRAFDRLYTLEGRWTAADVMACVEGWSPWQVREAATAVHRCVLHCERRDDLGSAGDYQYILDLLDRRLYNWSE